MKIPKVRFNFYLPAALCLGLAFLAACSTARQTRQPQAIMRFHVETTPAPAVETTTVAIYRAKPVVLSIAKDPALDERFIDDARVVESMGGYSLEIKFGLRGTWMLEQISLAQRGKRLAIFCAFAGMDTNYSRWLAAPMMNKRLADGVLVFTPDATREETELIAAGVNQTVKLRKKNEL